MMLICLNCGEHIEPGEQWPPELCAPCGEAFWRPARLEALTDAIMMLFEQMTGGTES